MAENTDLQLIRRKIRDRSIALVISGTALLLPPIGGIVRIDGTIFGIPIPLAYVFIVWALLIGSAAFLARPLRDSDKTAPSDSTGGDGI